MSTEKLNSTYCQIQQKFDNIHNFQISSILLSKIIIWFQPQWKTEKNTVKNNQIQINSTRFGITLLCVEQACSAYGKMEFYLLPNPAKIRLYLQYPDQFRTFLTKLFFLQNYIFSIYFFHFLTIFFSFKKLFFFVHNFCITNFVSRYILSMFLSHKMLISVYYLIS